MQNSIQPGSAGFDEHFMRMALRIARRGRGRVEPNPMVGCVIVKEGRVIGDGYHRQFGGPHAEVGALAACEKSGQSAQGGTAYVTLEPCCHFGKTPPCTEALVRAGVGRVVAAIEDPNPVVAGKGASRLRQAGITVDLGICATEATQLAAPFLKRVSTGRPWVIAKWAQSLDGKIATHSGDSKWITGERARTHANRMRGRVDAILVGVNTVLKDDPLLTARRGHPRRSPARVVIDSTLKTPISAQVVSTARATQTWLFCTEQADTSIAALLTRHGCRVKRVRSDTPGAALDAVLDELGAAGMSNVIVEGGGTLLGSFLDQGLVDEAHIYLAPLLIGGQTAPGPWNGRGVERIAQSLRLRNPHIMDLDSGWLVRGRLRD